jgi:hypothetical protein
MRMPVMLAVATAAFALCIPFTAMPDTLALVNANLKSELDVLIAEGSYNDALALIDKVERRGSLPPEMQLKRGIVLMQLGDIDEARKVFERLRDAYPTQAAPYVNLAAIAARADDLERASQNLTKARDLAPKQASTHESLGRIHLGLAWKSFKLAAELDPGRQALLRKNELIESLIKDSAPTAVPATASAKAAVPEPASPPLPPPAPTAEEGRVAPPSQRQSEVTLLGTRSTGVASPVAMPRSTALPALEHSPETPRATVARQTDASVTLCPPADESACSSALQSLETWRQDWSQRALEKYREHYLPGYFPPQFKSAAQWIAFKKRVFDSAGNIQVSLNITAVKWLDGKRLSIAAVQRYQSATYRDQTRKRFVMIRDGDRWRLASEQTDET